jgi:hypothetical protein
MSNSSASVKVISQGDISVSGNIKVVAKLEPTSPGGCGNGHDDDDD